MLKAIRYKNDLSLSYAEYGDPGGFPILVQHGLIASIKDSDLFTRLINMGTRLVCIARPGYGASSPCEMEHIAEWGEIVSVLVDELELSQFDVLGISSGAPYSYAIGYRFPHCSRYIFILSGMPALYDERVQASWPYPVNKNASLAEMQKLANELFFSHVSPPDLEMDDIRDSMANDCFGVAQDLRLRGRDWGFSLSEISQAVILRHSRADDSVPLVSAQLTSRLLPNCRLEVREKDVHFSPAVLDDFIQTSMAGYYQK